MAEQLLQIDGTPRKKDGRDIWSTDLGAVIRSIDKEKRILVMTGSTEARDRQGDIIRMSGWDLANYIKNPVFLWAHNYESVPIAASQKVVRRKGDSPRLDFFVKFPTKGIYPFADMIFDLYGEGIINASSVGFLPNKWADIPQDDKSDNPRHRWGGREFTAQELLELSGCAVPANPEAIQCALVGKSIGTPEELSKWLFGSEAIPRPAKEDDVLEELIGKEVASIEDEYTGVSVAVPKEIEEVLTTVAKSEEVPDPPKNSTELLQGRITELEEKIKSFSQIVESLTKSLDDLKSKEPGTIAQAPTKEVHSSASAAILGEVFKAKPAPAPQEKSTDIGALTKAMVELAKALKEAKVVGGNVNG
jgi:hypothetical protein